MQKKRIKRKIQLIRLFRAATKSRINYNISVSYKILNNEIINIIVNVINF